MAEPGTSQVEVEVSSSVPPAGEDDSTTDDTTDKRRKAEGTNKSTAKNRYYVAKSGLKKQH